MEKIIIERLPKELVIKIYEYDNTKYTLLSNVMHELKCESEELHWRYRLQCILFLPFSLKRKNIHDDYETIYSEYGQDYSDEDSQDYSDEDSEEEEWDDSDEESEEEWDDSDEESEDNQ
jgi:hypothetical protein